jgi:tripartite-type tricarboxylate transporter receptor subunit TctC
VSSWTGMYGPAGLPAPVLRRLNAEFVKAMKDAGVVKRLGDMGFDAIGNTPEEFAARMKTEVALAARLVKLAGIQPE